MTDTTIRWLDRRSGRTAHADDVRSPDEVDYARIVHSSAFRRLQGKTQILALGDDDFYRTRLTHSLEVAQVAQGVLQQLRGSQRDDDPQLPSPSLISAIGLAHDLGHPPFGHGGELALNYCMRADGGFEGNAQTLRIVGKLEGYSPAHGADLTRRSLLGLLKYPVARSLVTNPAIVPSLDPHATTVAVLDRATCKPAKAYGDEEQAIVDWLLEPFSEADRALFTQFASKPDRHAKALHKAFDCSIMDVADDIAYGVHDLEDAIALGFVDPPRFCAAVPPGRCALLLDEFRDRPLADSDAEPYDALVATLFGEAGARKRTIGRLVNHLLRNTERAREDGFADLMLGSRIRLRADARDLLDALQALVVTEVIESARVQHLEFKGQRMVVAVFEAMASDPQHLLSDDVFAAYDAGGGNRAICDHVAAMTDSTLLKTYERLFSPRMGSVFDRL